MDVSKWLVSDLRMNSIWQRQEWNYFCPISWVVSGKGQAGAQMISILLAATTVVLALLLPTQAGAYCINPSDPICKSEGWNHQIDWIKVYKP